MNGPVPGRRAPAPAALLFLGFACGLSMAVVVCGRRVERAVLENQRLEAALSEARRDLERLGAGLAKARRPVIEEIGLELTGDAGEDREELRGLLRRRLEILIGKDPADLDPEVVAATIGGIGIQVEDRFYRAEPELIVLAGRSFFRIAVAPAAGERVSE